MAVPLSKRQQRPCKGTVSMIKMGKESFVRTSSCLICIKVPHAAWYQMLFEIKT